MLIKRILSMWGGGICKSNLNESVTGGLTNVVEKRSSGNLLRYNDNDRDNIAKVESVNVW